MNLVMNFFFDKVLIPFWSLITQSWILSMSVLVSLFAFIIDLVIISRSK